MGTVLTFQAQALATRKFHPGAEMGKLLLFTGVRYEREIATNEGVTPREAGGSRPWPSRRPT